jgi:hypothetical protein
MSFENNYKAAFPENPVDGETFSFNQRNYTYNASMNNWYCDGTGPDEVIDDRITWALIDFDDPLKRGVVSIREDIINDMKWIDLTKRQQSEMALGELMAYHYPEQIAAGEVLNYTLEDLTNYIDELTWCLIDASTPDEVQWPKKPWID